MPRLELVQQCTAHKAILVDTGRSFQIKKIKKVLQVSQLTLYILMIFLIFAFSLKMALGYLLYKCFIYLIFLY